MRTFNYQLTDLKISKAKPRDKPWSLLDGGGLYLWTLPSGTKSWRYHYRMRGKEGTFTIGNYPEIGLADARDAHRAARNLVAKEQHPLDARRSARQEQEKQRRGTFGQACEEWRAKTDSLLAPTTVSQRERELKNDILPTLGRLPLAEIRRDTLSKLLAIIRKRAPEVARNCRTHINSIFEHAIDCGLSENNPTPPVRLLGPRKQKKQKALPARDLTAMFRALKAGGQEAQTEIAFRLIILTMLRKNEVLGASWSEFDLDAAEWTVPAERMKERREHWVPLSTAAVDLLKELSRHSRGTLLFPNRRDSSRPMAGRSMNALLHRLGLGEVATIHGFRSTASTYLNEALHNADVIELALAHGKEDVRSRYNRAEHRNARRKLMQDWADVLATHERAACDGPQRLSNENMSHLKYPR